MRQLDYVSMTKKWFPHLQVVCDFTKSKYAEITAEERNLMSQKELAELIKAEREEFTKSRDPSCFGGSDIGTIFGKGFIPPSQLAAQKMGRYKEVFSKETKLRLEAGHRAEPLVRQAFERVSGIRAFEWPLTMVNPKYPKFRMNIDGLVIENGKIGIYEGKYSDNWQKINRYYRKARDLREKGIEPPLTCCPENYLFQVWGYLAGMELDFAYLCGGWGFSDDQIGYIRIPRLPKDDEETMMETCDEFMTLCNSGITPSDADFVNKDRLLDWYKERSAISPASGAKKKFNASDAAAAREYLRLKDELESIKALSDAVKEEHEYKKKEDEMKAIEAYFQEELMNDRTGIAKDEKGAFMVSFDDNGVSTTQKIPRKELKEKHPDLYDAVFKETPKREFSIKEVEEVKS